MCLSRTVGYFMAGRLWWAIPSDMNTFSKRCVCIARSATPRPSPYIAMCVGLRLQNVTVLHSMSTMPSGGLPRYRAIVYRRCTVRVRHSKMLYCQSIVLCHHGKVPWMLEAALCHTVSPFAMAYCHGIGLCFLEVLPCRPITVHPTPRYSRLPWW